VGIHGVGSGGDRARAGAGYYGSMDLSGNLAEQVVTIGHPQGRAFRGTHGDGRLDPQGRATNPDWQPTADTSYFAHRGGSWVRHPNHGRVADRGFGLVTDGALRLPTRGFRAVRTARGDTTAPRSD
jgi:formylglycine-generating enzyme required for sulfatase activity